MTSRVGVSARPARPSFASSPRSGPYLVGSTDREVPPMSLAETRQLLGAWLTAVADVVRGVNAAEPLDVQLSRIAEQACRLVGFDLCAVMLVDPTGQWLQARGSHGLAAEYVAR